MTQTSGKVNTMAQFITVVIIFIFVLAVTYIVTKWLAEFQKGRINSNNISVLETYKLTTNKFVQIVKTGDKYFAIAICKDTVTLLGELQEGELKIPEAEEKTTTLSFKEILDKAKKFKTR